MSDVRNVRELYHKTDNQTNRIFNFFYLITVGVLLAWVMVSGIVDTTIFQRTHFLNLIRVFFVVLAFGVILSHEIATKIAFWLFVAATCFIITGFMVFAMVPEGRGMAFDTAELLLRTVQYMLGMRAHTFQYENIIVWTLILLFSFVVTYFGYVKLRFWLLLVLSTITTSIAITSPYFRNERIFYVFIFCLLVLVVVKLQDLNRIKIGDLAKTMPLSKQIIPVTAVVVMLAMVIPTPPTGGEDGWFRRVVQAPFVFVNDLFTDLTTQAEFSIANVGFGGRGGRLGGDVALNNRLFMRIRTSTMLPLYLTGATSDTYTGHSWLSLHTDYNEFDRSYFGQHLEAMENYIRNHLFRLGQDVAIINSGRPLEGPERIAWTISTQVVDGEVVEEIFYDTTTGFFLDPLTYHWIQISNDPYSWRMWPTSDFAELYGPHRLIVDTLNTRMSSLFHTGVVHQVTVPDDVEVVRNRDGRLVTRSRMGRGTTYEIALTDVYSGTRRYGDHPRAASYPGILADIALMLETFTATYGYYMTTPLIQFNSEFITYPDPANPTVYNATSTVNLLNNYLIPRANQIREIYTQLPDTLPDRVRYLAEFVTADATNDYERMLLLEAFLRASFAYTLSPGPSPVGQDFVDHFLFDLQLGYCVHFATTFVVMARTLGMPTRYVEGFVVHGTGRRFDDIDVRNNMAHAWPEVYFEGYGWVRFEPTPTYAGSDDGGFGGGGVGGIDGGEHWGENWPYWLNQGDDRDYGQPGSNIPSGQGGNQGGAGNVNVPTAGIGITVSPIVLITIGISVIPITIIVRLGYVKHQKMRGSKTDNNAIMNREYQRLLGYLQLFGHVMASTETEIAFMERIKGQLNLPKHEQELLVATAEIYAKGRYSDLAITDIELTVFAKINARLDGRVIDHVGKVQYWLHRNLIGNI